MTQHGAAAAAVDAGRLGPGAGAAVAGARSICKRTGMRVDVAADHVSDELPEEHKTCVYRVVQEALNNCSKHAAARLVRLTVQQEPSHLLLTVQDDGQGFEGPVERGLGLLGMEERVTHLGGSLSGTFIVVKLGVNSFIATLGMGSILAAVEVIISSNSQPIPPTSTAWNNITQTTVGGFQIIVLYLVILAFILWWLTAHTPVGRYLYAIGGNADAARLSGVRINRYTTFALVMSATIAGFAGIMFSSLNGPSLDFGSTLLLPAFAAAFLGSTQLIPGRFNVWGTLLAIYVLATGVQGLQLVSGASWLSDMFNGVALIIAVALSIKRSPSALGQRLKGVLRRGSGGAAGGPEQPGTGADASLEEVAAPVGSEAARPN